MHFLLLLVIIVLLIILLSRTNSKNNYTDLKNSIDRLNKKIINLTVHNEALKKEKEASREIAPAAEKKEAIMPKEIFEKPAVKETEITVEALKPELADNIVDEKIPEPVGEHIEPL